VPIIDPAKLEGVHRPEILFAWVAAVGTPLEHLSRVLGDALRTHGYHPRTIRLSDFLKGFTLPTPQPDAEASEYRRLDHLMSRGNELRERMGGGEALALLGAVHIAARRPPEPPHAFPEQAFILRQLKHPDEAVWLRTIYGRAFHLIGVSCPERVRLQYLHVMRGLSESEARELIERDRGEQSKFGQHVARTFHHSDLFVELRGYDPASVADARGQVERYLRLLFGALVTPTRDEYGMYLAHSAALRSADLSRQVGAAILKPTGEVVSLGANEVPAAGGGQYWGGTRDGRDFVRGHDANAVIREEALEEVVGKITPGWSELPEDERRARLSEAARMLGDTRVMNLTEFGRAVHAEMEAILAAGRLGVPTTGCHLYTTTFPCHNCAKHVIGAGLARVVYVEPYPKSLADRLHGDAIAFPEDEERSGKVVFEPFRGVAPRTYGALFSSLTPEGSRLVRKNSAGEFDPAPVGLRIGSWPLTHVDRERVVAQAIQGVLPRSRPPEEEERNAESPQ
jgi:deoxycytidylate deaminase